MYAGRSQRFMDAYEKAVGRPYGYLLVDLKPTTSSDRRLVPNGLTEADSDSDECSAAQRQRSTKRLWADFCGSGSDNDDGDDCRPPSLQQMFGPRRRPRKYRRVPCPDCGSVLAGVSNFTRHVLEQHPKDYRVGGGRKL